MGNKQNIFQILLLVIFGIMAVIGTVVLVFYEGAGGVKAPSRPIRIWGPPVMSSAVRTILSELEKQDEAYKYVSYVEKNPISMYGELLETIAAGKSPDLVIITASDLLPLRNKITPITFEALPSSDYADRWVEGAEIFVLEEGAYALPLLVDPLVLYWNRDLFVNEGIAQTPTDWDTFLELVPRLSHIVGGADLTQSAIAFGEYDNVLHSKEIVSTLFMQTGIDIVDSTTNGYKTDFKSSSKIKPESALKFYTAFSNPVKLVYSWNKTFDRSREAFTANKVAMYAGLVSEEEVLNEINPNLNFGMSVFPQSNNDKPDRTYGNFYGIAILKTSSDPSFAYHVANLLASSAISKKLSVNTKLPSVRRDVLTSIDNEDPFSRTKVKSAIMSHAWLQPAPISSVDAVFADVINNIVSGTIDSGSGVSQLSTDLDALLKPYNK